VRETAYTESERRGGDTNRALLEFSERIASRFARRFDTAPLGMQRLTHFVEPSLTYVYVPWQDQRDFPQFDRIDFVNPQNHLVLRVGNRWLGRSASADGTLVSREVASLDIAQSVNLQPQTREFSTVFLDSLTPERVDQTVTDVVPIDENFSRARERRWSNLVLDARVWPWPTLGLHGMLAANVERPKTEGVNTGVEFRLPELLLFDLAHTYDRGATAHGLRARAEIHLWQSVLLDVLTRYDLNASSLSEQGVGLRYTTCCWEASLRYTYRSRGPGESIENDIRLSVDIRVPTPRAPASSADGR
jgi:hypothetical protein